MEFPTELNHAINQAFVIMLEDPFHNLIPKYRVPIYKAIETLDEAVAIKFRTWLAILTARKVASNWLEEMPRDKSFQNILDLTEKLALGTLNLNETSKERDNFYYIAGNADENVEDGKALAAIRTAYSALRAASGYIPFSDFSTKQIEEDLPDELIGGVWADAASSAIIAYSGSAYNTDILYEKDFALINDNSELGAILMNHPNVDFDPEIRKEFWEWWLIEAIPQAWELAQQSNNH